MGSVDNIRFDSDRLWKVIFGPFKTKQYYVCFRCDLNNQVCSIMLYLPADAATE